MIAFGRAVVPVEDAFQDRNARFAGLVVTVVVVDVVTVERTIVVVGMLSPVGVRVKAPGVGGAHRNTARARPCARAHDASRTHRRARH